MGGKKGKEEEEEAGREDTRSTTTSLVKLLKVRLHTYRGCIDVDLVFRSSCHGSSSTCICHLPLASLRDSYSPGTRQKNEVWLTN